MRYLFMQFWRMFFSSKAARVLVIFQNNNELRGGGGFMTQIAEILIGRSHFNLKFLHNYHELQGDYQVAPPVPMKDMLKVKAWLFHDANYSGDFKKSAKQTIYLYNKIYPHNKVAAVIAVNFSFLEEVLGILGQIRINGKTIDQKNIFHFLSASVSDIDHHDLKQLNERKDILRQLLFALLKAASVRFWNWGGLLKNCRNAFPKKDIQVFFDHAEIQKRLAGKKLFFPFEISGCKDFLAIVENNFLGIKTNRYMRRLVFHDVHFDFDREKKKLGDAVITTRLDFEHFGSYNYPLSGTYQSYVTVFIPKEAENVRSLAPANFAPDVAEQDGFKTAGFKVLMKPGEKLSFIFKYSLPAAIFQDSRYSFKYIKQSGVRNEHIFETICFPDQYLAETSSGNIKTAESKAFLEHNNLSSDFSYSVSAIRNNHAPRIFYHEIVSPKLINIRFNEPVFFTGSPLKSVEVTEKGSDNSVSVKKVELNNDNRHLWIHVDDLPHVYEKYYTIALSNLKNLAGIGIQPQLREVTVVYRKRRET